MKKKLLFAIALFTISFTNCNISVAQSGSKSTIKGKVVSSDSLKSLDNAYVYLLDANKNLISKTRTDEKGWFAFNDVTDGIYKIRAKSIGYKIMISKNFKIQAGITNSNFRIKLNPSAEITTISTPEIDETEYFDLLEERETSNPDDK